MRIVEPVLEASDLVESLRQFDQHHPNVGGHGENHFPYVFGLAFLAIAESQLAELSHPLHNPGDARAESFFQLLRGDGLFFQHVVEQPGGDGFLIQSHAGQESGHGQRMVQIGLTLPPHFALVDLRAEHVGFLE